jgi:hypothetical protein
MTYPAVIFLIVLLWSFTWPKEKLVYLLFGTAAFNSLAVVPPAMLGGLNLLPNALTALVMIGRYACDKPFLKSVGRTAFGLDRMGLLTAFMGLALLSAAFFPKMYANQVVVVPMRGLAGPLYPSAANFTQAAYLTISFLVAIIFAASAGSRRFCEMCIRAFLLGGALVALTGVADFIIGSSAAKVLLDPFKTAQYTFMVDNQVLGMRRVVGVMTEASAFGGVAVFLAAIALFSAPLLPNAKMRLYGQLIAVTLIILSVLSASSTAYLGLAALAFMYVAVLSRRTFDDLAPGRHVLLRVFLISELTICYLIVLGLALVLMLAPDLFETPLKFIDQLIFKKSQGDSYLDRMSWNRLAMQALWQTGGVGVGVGGARASNWAVAVLSNTGLLGGFLLFGFLGLNMVRPANSPDRFTRNLLLASRAAVLVNTFMAVASTTSPDFGLTGGALYGLIVANVARRARVHQRVRRSAKKPMRAGPPMPSARPPPKGPPPRPTRIPAAVVLRNGGRMARRSQLRTKAGVGPPQPTSAEIETEPQEPFVEAGGPSGVSAAPLKVVRS